MTSPIVTKIRNLLIQNADEKTKASAQRFFKEEVRVYGVKSAAVSKIQKQLFEEVKVLDKKEIFAICEELYQSDYEEEAWIAASWADTVHKKYEQEDINIFERWINTYINDWAKCDTLCNHAVSSLIEQYPQHLKRLKQWSHSSNRWVKRASAVTLIIPARKGMFLNDIFEIADMLLLDKDDMVQKGYGWMLKAASQAHQQEVFEYVMEHKNVMPRTALRYAIEKMPQDLKQKAMAI